MTTTAEGTRLTRTRTPRRDINQLKAALLMAEAEQNAHNLVKAPPNGSEKYKGNGNHTWEDVADYRGASGHTDRLRVPGGWLYRVYGETNADIADNVVFVPLPAAIGYAV